MLRNNPGPSAVAIATIALAIGANTAMFSFVNGVLLSPLPYPESSRIVRVLEKHPTGGLNGISTLNYLDWTNQNAVFEYMAGEVGWRATLTGGDEPVWIRGARVSAHYFDIFGAKPALGRMFLPGEDQVGKDRVVLLSHVLWENRFGSDPAMLGRDILLDGVAHTVIGILQKDSPFDRTVAQIWKPLAFQPSNMTRDFRWLGASAKLKPGMTLALARAEMDVIGRRIANAYPDSNKGWGVAVDRLADVVIGPGLRTGVTVLFAATLFVLLIGCANLANLALARSISRQGEMAVRAALGASRRHLVRLLLIENVVISVCGGIVGVGVGYAMLKWIQWLIPPSTLPPAVDIRMDTSVLLFTMTVAVVTGLLFGVAPAAQTTNPNLVSALKEGGHGTTTGSPGRRVRGVLVVAEIAFAFVLLVASGLLMRSFFNLLDIDPGFNATNVLTASLPINQEQHPDTAELNAYLGSISAAVEAVPGVRETAMTSALPLQGWGYGVPYSIADREIVDPVNRPQAFFKIVSPSYFDALGIKLLAGRVLSDDDTAGAPRVAVINEALARREFRDADPIGRRIQVREIVPGETEFGQQIAWEIVGVIKGERITGLGDEISAGMYVSNQQSPTYGINLIVQSGRAFAVAAESRPVGCRSRQQGPGARRCPHARTDRGSIHGGEPRHEHAPRGVCIYCALARCRWDLRRDFLHGRPADARNGHSRVTWSQRWQPANADIPGRDVANVDRTLDRTYRNVCRDSRHVVDALRRRCPRPADNRCCGRRTLRGRRVGVFPASLADHESRSNGSAAISMKLAGEVFAPTGL